jgi:hypothetical protein
MTRVLAAIGITLLLTGAASAQSYCQQVKDAVKQYGYRAAKAHAVAYYSPEEVRAADRCLSRKERRS